MADAQANDNSTCVVCFKTVQYYSIGECDHPVCFECSTRMRVLCQQNECPICRQALARVVFTETVQTYKELRNQVFSDKLFERQFKIGFCTDKIKQAYESLLENNCRLCEKSPPFRSFSALSDHMRKAHERYYCDLCVKHLKIFTSERKCYTRQELAHHRRKGDLDDTSHRGHPLCEFCEERFMDADELYRHLRKEHLYCHLCDADGRNHYYASHAALAHHFRTDHYLCEEGECAGQHLTAVFRSEIDLKAHKASLHGKGLTRTAARQARTLELQFNITPHAPQRTPRDSRQQQREEPPPSPPPAQAPPPRIDTRSDEHFPRLSAAAPAPLVMGAVSRTYRGAEGLARTNRNFPALDGGNAAKAPPAAPAKPAASAMLRNSKPSVSIQLHSQPASASNFRLTQPTGHRISVPAPPRAQQPLSDEDFPSLGIANDNHPSLGAGTVQPSKVTMINSQEMQALKKTPNHQTKKAPLNAEAFPALSSTSAPTKAPQWVKVSKTKEKAKPTKPEPPPPREANFNPVADFPTLPVNNTKNKSKNTPTITTQPSARKPAPAPQIPTSQTDNNVNKPNSKKDKKKNNVKKENLMFDDNNYEYLNDKKIVRDLAHVLSSVNNNQSVSAPVEHRNIKTVADTSASAGPVNEEKNRNGGGNGDFKLTAKDYPALGKGDSAPPKRVANGSVQKSVPPGFSKPRPACDGMTFTNSSGQMFSAPVHTYIPPPEFESRNRALVQKFTAALGSPAAVEEFKVASRAFRDNILTANEFYSHCQSALGSQLDGVFLEMVALLPDIAKQQELVVGRKAGSQLDVCSTCGQLLAPEDHISHDTAHWPPLSR